jgi:hypothetical protein
LANPLDMAVFVKFLIWMLEHNFLVLYFGITLGIMVASFLWVYRKYGAEAFKAQQGDGESDYAENAKQDSMLEKKLKNMKKGKGGF